jgi:hypothetical protein
VDPQDCTHCGATLADGAQWCSLCYAPVVDAALASSIFSGGNPASVLLAEPLATTELRTDLTTTEPATAAPTVAERTTAEPTSAPDELEGTWPCLGCETPNSMRDSVCAACGLPFLAHAKTPPTFHVPLLGDIFQRPRSQQITFIVAAGIAMVVVLLGLMSLFGMVF